MVEFTLHNYQFWMDHYLNGRLSPEDTQAAELFLLHHPEILDNYLQELEQNKVEAENVKLPGKELLKIEILPTPHIHAGNFQDFFIASSEGLLDTSAETELSSFLQANPKLKSEFELFKTCKVEPDLQLVYPNQNELRRRAAIKLPVAWSVGIAASILLLVGLFILIPRNTTSQQANALYEKLPVSCQVSLSNGKNKIQSTPPQKNHNDLNNLTVHQPPIKKEQKVELVELTNNNIVRVEIFTSDHNSETFPLASIPSIHYDPTQSIDDELQAEQPEKKGLFNKIMNGEPTYIEDYVNAGFNLFKGKNKDDDNTWALKVKRDKNGKSEKVKFTSPIFSAKTKN